MPKVGVICGLVAVGIGKRNLSSSPESDASIDGNIRFPTVIQISSIGLCQ